jgi:hypothetical protein
MVMVMTRRSHSLVLPAKQREQQQQVAGAGAGGLAGLCRSRWCCLGSQGLCQHPLEPLAGPNLQQQQGRMVARQGPSPQRQQHLQPSELRRPLVPCLMLWMLFESRLPTTIMTS